MPSERLTDRPRRLRKSQRLRDLVAETILHRSRLVQPHFVVDGNGDRVEIQSMPGIYRETVDTLMRTVEHDLALGIRTVLLFGISDHKDASASASAGSDALVSRAVSALRDHFKDDLVIATDVCLCAYMDHGQRRAGCPLRRWARCQWNDLDQRQHGQAGRRILRGEGRR